MLSADRISEIGHRIKIRNPILPLIKGSSRWALHNPVGQAVTGIVLSALTIVGLPGCGTPEGEKNSSTPTATSSAQKIDTPTTTPTATPKPESTPTPKPPENPLPLYEDFFGNLTDKKTGADAGMIVVVSKPQKEGNSQVFVYALVKTGGVHSFVSFEGEPLSNPDGSFTVSNRPGGPWRIQANMDGAGTILPGSLQNGRPGATPSLESSFKLQLNGTGRNTYKQRAYADILTIITQPGISGQIKPEDIQKMIAEWPD